MNEKLGEIAKRHWEARFIKIDVQNAPFLVVKLKVQVLPCVVCFVEGVSPGRVIGFEGLGGTGEDFRTGNLEVLLHTFGVLRRLKKDGEPRRSN